MEVEQHTLKSPGAEQFQGKDRSNPHCSVLSIGLESNSEGESVVVFYEC